MPSYTLEIEALGIYTTNTPFLEIWEDGVLHSSHSISSLGSSMSLSISYGGSLPSSLELRFDDGFSEPSRRIEIQSVKINNKYVNVNNFLSADSLTKGQGATLDMTNADFLFDASEPASSEFTTGATLTLTGGADVSRLNLSTSDHVFDALGGRDIIYLGSGNDKVSGNTGNDVIYGGQGHDLLFGSDGDDILYGEEGDDRIFGGLNNDRIHGDEGNDEIHGGAGNDRLNGNDGDDIITGGTGADRLNGGIGADYLFGDGGADTLMGGAGNDSIDGGAGNDLAYGGNGNDIINGGNGADILGGDRGDDIIDGGNGNDQIFGGADDDTLSGGAGNNILRGGSGNDIIYGVSATDSASVTASDGVLINSQTFTFDSGFEGWAYYDSFFGGGNAAYTDGVHTSSEGGESNGAIELISGGVDNSTRSFLANGIERDFTKTSATSDAFIEFSFRMVHDEEFDDYDFYNLFYQINGATANDMFQFQAYDNDGGDKDTGWQTFRLELGQLSAGTHTISLGGFLYEKDSVLEESRIFLDDITWGEIDTGSTTGRTNTFYAGAGNDTLYGSSETDIFIFETAHAFSGVTQIEKFDGSDLDTIDISELLLGFDPFAQDITNYVRTVNSGSNTLLQIDTDGLAAGSGFTTIAEIHDINDIDVLTFAKSGNLDVGTDLTGYGETPGTARSINVGESQSYYVGEGVGEEDFWFGVDLVAGTEYVIWARGSMTEGGSNIDPLINGIYASDGVTSVSGGDDDGGVWYDSRLYFTPGSTDRYYIDTGAYNDQGSIKLHVYEAGNIYSSGWGSQTHNGTANSDWFDSGQDDDILYGNGGNDFLWGEAGDDDLYGGTGADVLFGGNGADDFFFTSTDAIDEIIDFETEDGDRLDISNILVGFGGGDDIDDFVLFTTTADGDTMMSVDVNGTVGGVNFVDVAVLLGNTGEVVQTLYDNGDIVV